MRMVIALVMAAALAPMALTAQSAKWETFGVSCAWGREIHTQKYLPPPIDQWVSTSPIIGSELAVSIEDFSLRMGYQGDAALLLIGISNVAYNGKPLPQMVPTSKKCTSTIWAWAPCLQIAPLVMSVPHSEGDQLAGPIHHVCRFDIPKDPALIGCSLYFQYWMSGRYREDELVPPICSDYMGYSKGGKATIGNK